MIIAFVTEGGIGAPYHYFPTWAQAEAFAAAVGLKALTTTDVDIHICNILGIKNWEPVAVIPGASPPKVLSAAGPVVGADWLDANLGGES